ncbi:outer membrane protein assembly factor BamD [Ferruginivarius sediminum]|nr:outer membrane protein assembly factor BamD [Ferruginivarius sediminum]
MKRQRKMMTPSIPPPHGNRTGGRRRAGFGVLLAAALGLAIAGCSSSDEDEYIERSVSELYNNAMDELAQENYVDAAKLFDEVERQHPYSVWASKAQLMAAFSYYQDNKYDEAINALDRFIELHPGNRDVAYAYYLKGLSYYERISDVRRDQKMTVNARQSLEEVVQRFPDSKYARDARLKLDLTTDHLAGKEMAVGRFYLERGHYLAAINRFRTVIEEYQTTSHTPEALHRLVEAYLALGIEDEAKATAAVLGHNFPGSEWYIDSYELLTGRDIRPEADEDSWIGRVWNSLT